MQSQLSLFIDVSSLGSLRSRVSRAERGIALNKQTSNKRSTRRKKKTTGVQFGEEISKLNNEWCWNYGAREALAQLVAWGTKENITVKVLAPQCGAAEGRSSLPCGKSDNCPAVAEMLGPDLLSAGTAAASKLPMVGPPSGIRCTCSEVGERGFCSEFIMCAVRAAEERIVPEEVLLQCDPAHFECYFSNASFVIGPRPQLTTASAHIVGSADYRCPVSVNLSRRLSVLVSWNLWPTLARFLLTPAFVVHGSADSTDRDILYEWPILSSPLPPNDIIVAFVEQGERVGEDRNMFTTGKRRDQIFIRDCFRGIFDEVNNAMQKTLVLHEQTSVAFSRVRCPNTKLPRLVPLRVQACITNLLLRLRRIPSLRAGIVSALKSFDFVERVRAVASISLDEVAACLSLDDKKSLAFHFGQTMALMHGVELYTKEEIANAFPQLTSFVMRKNSEASMLDEIKNRFVESLHIMGPAARISVKARGRYAIFKRTGALNHAPENYFTSQCSSFVFDILSGRAACVPPFFGEAAEQAENDCRLWWQQRSFAAQPVATKIAMQNLPTWPTDEPKEIVSTNTEESYLMVGGVRAGANRCVFRFDNLPTALRAEKHLMSRLNKDFDGSMPVSIEETALQCLAGKLPLSAWGGFAVVRSSDSVVTALRDELSLRVWGTF